jgi:hypothetical protein
MEGLSSRLAKQRNEVCELKRVIRETRERLGAAKAALIVLEAEYQQECRRRGIGYTVASAGDVAPGEGATHGRAD